MNDNRQMPAKLSAFVIWVLVAAGLVFWGYRLFGRPLPAPANVQTVGEGAVARGDLGRLLGAAPVPVANEPPPVAVESNRFRLLGVLAPVASATAGATTRVTGAGVALIAVDGKPARAFTVGARLDGDLVLQSVARRSAAIGPVGGPPSVVLELPPPAPPTTGTLPRAVADGEPGRGVPVSGPTMQPPPMAPQPARARQPAEAVEEADDEEEAPPPQRTGGSPVAR